MKNFLIKILFFLILFNNSLLNAEINIAEFYFFESAETVKNRFKKEANLENIKIKKISKNKFKVYFGPYTSFASMKETYFSLNELGFENLDVRNINK